jgi:Skp family chaperone for outer membrane proteins
MRAGRWVAAAVLAVVLAGPAPAQNAPSDGQPVLVLRQNDLFERSAFGLASTARIEAANTALLAENREIESALEIEERDLTERRASLPTAEFQALSEAFNVKVEGIRSAQEAKSREIFRMRDEDRRRFVKAAGPVLAQIMKEEGAQVILDEQLVVLNLERIDITARAIARIDAAIGDGSALPAEPPPPAP